MNCTMTVDSVTYAVDLSQPADITIPVAPAPTVNAFHLPPASFEPFRMGTFVGSVEQGGPVRCDVVTLAPHGNGTHTECVGHIAGSSYSLRRTLTSYLGMAQLVSVDLVNADKGLMVSLDALRQSTSTINAPVLIIRTLPNPVAKRTMQWSGAEPPYIHPDAMQWIVDQGVEHLVVDLPSVDPEEDGGALLSHHIFWQWPDAPRVGSTITELVYVPNTLADGMYGVSFGIAPFDADAAPSTITLYPAAVL